MTTETIQQVTTEFAAAARNIYGEKLHAVILYGSCARGDFQPDSDIDMMVLLDVPHENAFQEGQRLKKIRQQLDDHYDVLTAPVYESKDFFQKWLPVLPFYQNIVKEGIALA